MRSVTLLVAAGLLAAAMAAPTGDMWEESTGPSCLDNADQNNLQVVLSDVSSTLAGGSHLQSARQFLETNPEKKAEYADSATKLETLNEQLLTHLNELSTSSCANCDGLNEAIQNAESTYAAHNAVPAVLASMKSAKHIAKQICPAAASGRRLLGRKSSGPRPPPPPPPPPCPKATATSCMCSKQIKDLNIAVMAISTAVNLAGMGINMAAGFENNPTKKSTLEKAGTALSAINSNVISQLQAVIGDGCPTCTSITNSIKTGLDAMDSTFTAVEPKWAQDKTYSAIFTSMKSLTGVAQGFCPLVDNQLMDVGDTCAANQNTALIALSSAREAGRMGRKLAALKGC